MMCLPYKSGVFRLRKEFPREDELLNKQHKTKNSRPFGRRLWMGAVSLAMAGIVVTHHSALQGSEALAARTASMSPPVVAAYAYDHAGLTLRDKDAAYLTQMNYSFALIENGRVTGSHWRNIKAFEKYVAKHPHILPVMAVGGWGADGFSQAAATQEGRELFAQSAIELMDKHGFRGIDIDWEYPGSTSAGVAASENDETNFTFLMQELRQQLDARTAQDGVKRYLSVALGAVPSQAKYIDLPAVGRLADQVNVMTYDLRGFEKTTGHHTNLYPSVQDKSNLSGDSAVSFYVTRGIPKNKVMLGAAFYGRCWREVQGGGDGLYQKAGTSGNKTYSYTQLKDMIASGKYEAYWDEAAKAPYLFGGSQFISYENEDSCRLKGQYAKDNGLMGVMFWEYGQDDTGELLKALYEGVA